jgi:uncharacterized membrane protein YbjE (DUF340 family)
MNQSLLYLLLFATGVVLTNIMREFSVLILAPWMVKKFGALAPISAGGATTMDTTLPIITKLSPLCVLLLMRLLYI